jgi:hypothetical protein
MAWRKALLPLLAKLEEEEKDKVAKLEEEKVNVTEHEKLKVKVPRSIKELILVLYLYRIMVSIRCSKMSDLAIRRRYISDEAYNSEGGKASFSENLNKVYGAFDNAFDSSFKKISFFVHI